MLVHHDGPSASASSPDAGSTGATSGLARGPKSRTIEQGTLKQCLLILKHSTSNSASGWGRFPSRMVQSLQWRQTV
jgi:hypothetical protein